jgi:hypothetical protein
MAKKVTAGLVANATPKKVVKKTAPAKLGVLYQNKPTLKSPSNKKSPSAMDKFWEAFKKEMTRPTQRVRSTDLDKPIVIKKKSK